MAKKTNKPSAKYIRLPKYLVIIIFINLIALDIWLLTGLLRTKTNVLGESSSCPQACINYINSSSVSTSTKEYFVPLGSGSNQTNSWQDVPGAQAYIDTNQYPKIKKVTFEATLEVPRGAQTSYVRLYNATDQHPVWFSEKSMSISGPNLLISNPIILDKGEKLYKVQMKSQLGILTNLVQSRVHILTY
ncbi:hypothetical protein ACFL1A_03390 [Patescibacteria group bacterium]